MTVTVVKAAVFPEAAVATAIFAVASFVAFLTILTVKSAFVSVYEALAVPSSFQESLEAGEAGKVLPHVKYIIPPSFPTPKLYLAPNVVTPNDGSTVASVAFTFLTNSRVSVPDGAAVVPKTTGSDDPSATQLTDEAVVTETLASETLTVNIGSLEYTVSV
jgi:hypothetical protein